MFINRASAASLEILSKVQHPLSAPFEEANFCQFFAVLRLYKTLD